MQPDISVVMCTYNGEKFIRQQLESILRQSLLPVEVIIGDDGSTDRTLHIARLIAETSPIPIRIHQNERQLGFADNFLHTCTRSLSAYIAFSDQDDRWAAEKLGTALAALLDQEAQLCVHAVQLIDVDGGALPSPHRQTSRARVIQPLRADPWGNFYGFTMLFERSLLEKIPEAQRGLDPFTQNAKLPHDRWIYFLASTFGRTVVLDERLAQYRQHGAQLYGGEQRRTIQMRIATKLSSGQGQARYLAGIAAHRASMLEDLAPARDGDLWLAGARRWRSIASHLSNSARLYDPMPIPGRIRILSENLQRGTYRSFKYGGLGVKRIVEDVTVSVARSFSGSTK